MKVCLITSSLFSKDGIGNIVISQFKAIKELGYQCDIYALHWDPEMNHIVKNLCLLNCKPDDLIINHIGGYSRYEGIIAKQPCKKVFYYHNITPPEFLRGTTKVYCKFGLRQLPYSTQLYDYIAGVSQYNLDCLNELGINREGDILQCPVEFKYKPKQSLTANKIETRFLFVGRCVENKKIEDVIDAFTSYNKHYNPNSRLSIVGNTEVSPKYTVMLKEKALLSGCKTAIEFTGKVSDEKLEELYEKSDVFLCMSEHEGFGIPLIEAMYNQLLVFAYDSSAVKETIGDGGILLTSKAPETVAEKIDSVLRDSNYKKQMLEKAKARADYFSYNSFLLRMHDLLAKWTSESRKRQICKKTLIKLRALNIEYFFESGIWRVFNKIIRQ